MQEKANMISQTDEMPFVDMNRKLALKPRLILRNVHIQICIGMLQPLPRLSMGVSMENQPQKHWIWFFNIDSVGNRMKMCFLILKKQMTHQISDF